jgi:hypothetical protein
MVLPVWVRTDHVASGAISERVARLALSRRPCGRRPREQNPPAHADGGRSVLTARGRYSRRRRMGRVWTPGAGAHGAPPRARELPALSRQQRRILAQYFTRNAANDFLEGRSFIRGVCHRRSAPVTTCLICTLLRAWQTWEERLRMRQGATMVCCSGRSNRLRDTAGAPSARVTRALLVHDSSVRARIVMRCAYDESSMTEGAVRAVRR